MSEEAPKKRGRPSKAEIEARMAAALAAPIPQADSRAQEYALRVWNGQSESADRPWRLERVRAALEAQGMTFEGVVLP